MRCNPSRRGEKTQRRLPRYFRKGPLVRRFAIAAWAASISVSLLLAQVPGSADLELDALHNGRYAEMSTTLERAVLFVQIEVARVRVTFGAQTTEELRRLVEGQELSSRLEDSVAAAAILSPDALVELRFLRDVSLKRFLSFAREAAERVRKRDLITEDTYYRISENLPFWYRALKDRGIREGDVLAYRVRSDRLHSVLRSGDGEVLVNQIDQGRDTALAVMGGYFVKGSDFREGLLNSFFRAGR